MKLNKISILKYLIGLIFLFSAVSKLFPVLAFEMQLVSHGITSRSVVLILARVIIAAELFLGLCYFQSSYMKKYFIPASMLLLIIFSLDMIYLIILKGPGGSCGCFGSVFTMTPLEALIKNLVLIALLNYLYKEIKTDEGSKILLPAVFLVISIVAVLIFAKNTPYEIISKVQDQLGRVAFLI
jgi:hypothetical protein